MRLSRSPGLAGLVIAVGLWAAGLWATPAAFADALEPAFAEPTLGPVRAKGAVVWSHGRSTNTEDSKSPTPVYLRTLRDDGWDVLRFDRPSRGDTLTDSTRRLVEHTAALKRQGYAQIVLAGQSFGAFLSLMAADASTEIDAVVATAPAAYGSFEDFYDSWRLNAARLYPLLEQVKRARVMVFYFHGDAFDPGGRGERSREILGRRGLGYAVIDQPAYLTTHWAASSGLFLRRFGDCIRDFANAAALAAEMVCTPNWGTVPSAELKLPAELAAAPARRGAPGAPAATAGSGAAPNATAGTAGMRDLWYGFYPNGREVLLGVESARADQLGAIYAIGPSIDGKHGATWSRRHGRVVEDGFVFEEPGKSTLRFRLTQGGGLAATWIAADGKTSMSAQLKPIDPELLARRHAGEASAAAGHGGGPGEARGDDAQVP